MAFIHGLIVTGNHQKASRVIGLLGDAQMIRYGDVIAYPSENQLQSSVLKQNQITADLFLEWVKIYIPDRFDRPGHRGHRFERETKGALRASTVNKRALEIAAERLYPIHSPFQRPSFRRQDTPLPAQFRIVEKLVAPDGRPLV